MFIDKFKCLISETNHVFKEQKILRSKQIKKPSIKIDVVHENLSSFPRRKQKAANKVKFKKKKLNNRFKKRKKTNSKVEVIQQNYGIFYLKMQL